MSDLSKQMESHKKIKLESINWLNLIYFVGSIIIGINRPRFFAITLGCLFEYLRIYPNMYAKIINIIPIDLENVGIDIMCLICYSIIMILFFEPTTCAFYFFLVWAHDKRNNFDYVMLFFLFAGGVAAISPVAKMKSFQVDMNYFLDLSVAFFLWIYFIRNTNKIVTFINQLG